MRFSSQESATLVAALSYLRSHLTEGAAPEQCRNLKPLSFAQMQRLEKRIGSGEKELVYIGIHGGVAAISATKGVAFVHADFDTLEADPDHSLPYLDKGRSAKRAILKQVEDGLERLLELRSANAGATGMNKLRRRLWHTTGAKRIAHPTPTTPPHQSTRDTTADTTPQHTHGTTIPQKIHAGNPSTYLISAVFPP